MKVVINKCFGGFGLSDLAFEKLLKKKGVAFVRAEDEAVNFNSNYYEVGHKGEEDYFISQYHYYENRSDPDLIAVVEELQEKANGWAAELAIVDVPDEVKWHIHEYDGLEHVAEDHRVWS
jgi:hypothetical protein